jgi:hypothetical protein
MSMTWLRSFWATAWECLYACLWLIRSNIEDHAWALWEAVKCYRDALAYCAACRA